MSGSPCRPSVRSLTISASFPCPTTRTWRNSAGRRSVIRTASAGHHHQRGRHGEQHRRGQHVERALHGPAERRLCRPGRTAQRDQRDAPHLVQAATGQGGGEPGRPGRHTHVGARHAGQPTGILCRAHDHPADPGTGPGGVVQDVHGTQSQLRVLIQEPGQLQGLRAVAGHQGLLGQPATPVCRAQARRHHDACHDQQRRGRDREPEGLPGGQPGQQRHRGQRGRSDDAPGLVGDPQADPQPVQVADGQRHEDQRRVGPGRRGECRAHGRAGEDSPEGRHVGQRHRHGRRDRARGDPLRGGHLRRHLHRGRQGRAARADAARPRWPGRANTGASTVSVSGDAHGPRGNAHRTLARAYGPGSLAGLGHTHRASRGVRVPQGNPHRTLARAYGPGSLAGLGHTHRPAPTATAAAAGGRAGQPPAHGRGPRGPRRTRSA